MELSKLELQYIRILVGRYSPYEAEQFLKECGIEYDEYFDGNSLYNNLGELLQQIDKFLPQYKYKILYSLYGKVEVSVLYYYSVDDFLQQTDVNKSEYQFIKIIEETKIMDEPQPKLTIQITN